MATRLGDVSLKINLDVTDANRQLTQSERRIATDRDRGLLGGQAPARTPGALSKAKEQEEGLARRITSALVKRAGGGLAGNPLAAQAQSGLGSATPFVEAVAGARGAAALRVAGTAAIAYGIASQAVKMLPEAFAFGKQLTGEAGAIPSADPRIKLLEDTLENWRVRLVELESKFTSIVGAFQQTDKFNTAAMRLTGSLPDSEYYVKMFKTQEEGRIQLDAKFETWKAKEAPFVFSRTLVDFFKRSVSQ